MDSNLAFFLNTRAQFSELTEKADRQHVRYWDEAPTKENSSYSWFESIARTLNAEMQRGTYLAESQAFLSYVEKAFLAGSAEVKNCIDVALIENLFWQVSPRKAEPYWQGLPETLQALYIDFYGHPPR